MENFFSSCANDSRASQIVQDISNRKLHDHLKIILSDECILRDVAGRSYRHQLGFVKLVLHSDHGDPSLRLHVWDKDSSKEEDIHSHCAEFVSRVVFGRLDEITYTLDKGNDFVCFGYHFDSISGCSVAVQKGLASVSVHRSRTVSEGDAYHVSICELHKVTNVLPGTVTISAWGPRNSEAVVLKTIDAQASDCTATAGMPLSYIRKVLEEIVERLSGT